MQTDYVAYPGKFEGEPTYVPHFWELVMNGDGEDFELPSGALAVRFTVDLDDVDAFPVLDDRFGDTIVLIESELGFVYHWWEK